MRTYMSVAAAFAAVLVISGPSVSKADQASAEILAGTCFSCHGEGGQSVGAMPSINGKPAQLLELNLKSFRDGKRASTVMQRISKGFTDAEIKALAAYLEKNTK